MLPCAEFHSLLQGIGIEFFTGVPDSLLKNFCAYLEENLDATAHIIAANEGNAVALATGHYLATGRPGLVYMQNSGQGNATNPLVSLADPEVYGVPMLLLVGWRGEPGVKDEPQHVKQGKITHALFDTLGIPHCLLPDTIEAAQEALAEAGRVLREEARPYALIAKAGVFTSYQRQRAVGETLEIRREAAIAALCAKLGEDAVIVSTTGKISRELYEIREGQDRNHSRDFLTVGSMGHASQIALGIACAKTDRSVYCFDGDGAAIMHMGGMALIGSLKPRNFKHVILNNGAHDSVGGQPTAGLAIDLSAIAKACGYAAAFSVEHEQELSATI
ncbi:MAG: phosphonopyruvate decarboxylase, partial [Coriobacteriia bacterium]|nr:phosphonopyruvate decarboxylase [Coriobacteriia bacterium]